MAEFSVQTTARTGLNPTFSALGAGGDEFVNTGVEVFYVKNGGGSPCVVTIVTPATVDGLAVADRTVSVPAGEDRIIGPFPTATYNDGTGKVQLTYDQVVTCTGAVVKVGT